MRRSPALAGLAGLAGLVLTGCAYTPPQALAPQCSTTRATASSAVVLMAQSVPSASLLPCVALVPAGWTAQGFAARDGQTTFTLNSDRAGERAVVVRLQRRCEVAGATRVPSDEPGATRFERVTSLTGAYVGTRYYLFPGGCATYEFHLRGELRAVPVSEASLAVGFLTRTELEHAIERESHGRLRLDG